jgi:hypothetical protein
LTWAWVSFPPSLYGVESAVEMGVPYLVRLGFGHTGSGSERSALLDDNFDEWPTSDAVDVAGVKTRSLQVELIVKADSC